jgi:chromate reductase, NAD(P)H dehydrogenase (quinone)
MKIINIVGISGSIRSDSSSNVVMRQAAKSFSENVRFTLFERMADIPAFDGAEVEPEAVLFFKNLIKEADAVLFATPEYAFGIPGALKNAIDWTVGSGDLANKPVGLITASTGGENGHAAFQLVLTAIAAKFDSSTTLLISSIRTKVKDGEIIHAPTLELVKALCGNLILSVER